MDFGTCSHPTFNDYSLISVRVFQKCASGSSGKHFFVLGRSACSLSAPWLPVVTAKWVGTCVVRVGWDRLLRVGWECVASEAVPLSSLCCLKCRLLGNVLLAAAGSTFFLHFSMIVEGI